MNETRRDGGLIQAVIDHMERVSAGMAPDDPRRLFHDTYLRTTRAVALEVENGGFVDPAWVDGWDAVFADLYLDALELWRAGRPTPGPWQVAFDAGDGPRLPPLRLVLLGMNAHINYDLPQALLAVISDEDFAHPDRLERRAADHRRIDAILAARVAEEDGELKRFERPGDRTLLDRLLTPFNRAATRRFLAEARDKVWRNAILLADARRTGTYHHRLAELERLSRLRVEALTRPGQVLAELGRNGFGVLLEGA
jgi:hypothetical protein